MSASARWRPVLVAAGSSDTVRRFRRAGNARSVFTAHMRRLTAHAFDADLRAGGGARGRLARPSHYPPGPQPMIAPPGEAHSGAALE